MDDLDRASDHEERLREAAKTMRLPQLPQNGRCHNCGEQIAAGLLFCDADCRDDYQKAADARKRAGRR